MRNGIGEFSSETLLVLFVSVLGLKLTIVRLEIEGGSVWIGLAFRYTVSEFNWDETEESKVPRDD